MLAPTPKHGTLDGLIQWLERKPRDGVYSFHDSKNCLVCQYMRRTRLTEWPMEMRFMFHGLDRHRVAAAEPLTYGAALTRAYAARVDDLK